MPERAERPFWDDSVFERIFNCLAASVSIAAVEDGTYIEVNEEFLRVSAFTREEVIGKSPLDLGLFANPLDLQRIADELRQSGEVRNRETLFRIKSGQPIWGLLSAVPITIRGRACVLGVSRDLTELKRSEAALLELENRFRDVLAHAPVGLAIIDRNYVFTFAAGQAVADAGLRPENVIGRSLLEIFADDTKIIERVRQALAGKSEFGMVEVGTAVFDLWTSPIRADDGAISGMIGIGTNVTARVRAEQELRGAVRARDVFLSIASHELRNPLNALSLNLAAAVRSAKKQSPPVAQPLQAAAKQVDRLIHLVDELLDASRITTGQLTLKRERFDLSDVVTEIIGRSRDQLADFAFTSTPAVGYWDRIRLEQVVANLISNAIRYGEGKPISIALEQDGPTVRFRITDRGIGIAPEKHARIFEQFERASSDAHTGLGLGLWITKRIVEAHGGTISVRSELGNGAEFEVILPCEAKAGKAGEDDEQDSSR
jgi:PAS domain S-box-containing protein